MGLFQKNTGSKLFASSFAIETAEGDVIDQNLVPVGTVDTKQELAEPVKAISIADVVRLIRSLPNSGTEAELFAVLKTLEIFDVNVEYLLAESARKETVTSTHIEALQTDIKLLEEQIEQRQKEVAVLEVGLNELSKVNECLNQMASLGAQAAIAQDQVIEDGSKEGDRNHEKTTDLNNVELEAHDPENDKTPDYITSDDEVRNTVSADENYIDLDNPPYEEKPPKKAKISRRGRKKRNDTEVAGPLQ